MKKDQCKAADFLNLSKQLGGDKVFKEVNGVGAHQREEKGLEQQMRTFYAK